MLEFFRTLTASSACSYAAWRLRKSQDPIVLKTRLGARFELRPNSFGNNDYGVAYEIFVHDYYSDPHKAGDGQVRHIVDLGANVGYSLLYFLHTYPQSRIVAFEPHPRHAAQVVRNLAIDGNAHRVEFHAKAAGASARGMRLTDRGSGSTITDASQEGALDIEVVDVFPFLERERIDLLKIDIEGGEYEILADPRFERLDVGEIVMEWHTRGGGLADKGWCEERLRALGYEIEEIFTTPHNGMFHARPVAAHR